MPRDWSEDLQEIHQAYKRRDTLDVYLANDEILRLSRGAVSREIDEETVVYDNWIRSVDDLRSSTEQSIDRIRIKCQNVNSELGFNLAADLRLLDYAVADYGKIYQSSRNLSLIEDIPQVFRGVLANAEVDEQNFEVELIVDYESMGAILASRGLSPKCWWTYQNGVECTASSAEPACPKNRAACFKRHDGDGNDEAEFGGWEFFEEETNSAPGSGGNGGGGIGTCFTSDTLVWTPSGLIPIGEMKERVRKGNRSVYSFDALTGEISEDEIEAVWEHQTNGYFTFDFEHTSLNVTPEHKLFVALNEFKKTDKFRRNETIRAFVGTWFDSKLKRIKWHSDKQETVWNLRVKKNRTYFANECAVSNSKDPNEI